MGGAAIASLVASAMGMASKIIDIAVSKGDDGDDIRLKDIPGWSKLKKSVRKAEGLKYFKKEWAAARKKLEK